MPLREFQDSHGVNWRVWSTMPEVRGAHPRALDGGWLTFQCDNRTKRIFPIPDGWEETPSDGLERLLERAEETKPPRRSKPNEGRPDF